jgi:hypothetical protein
MYHDVTKDGALAQSARQGLDTLAEALKAFPDSIGLHPTAMPPSDLARGGGVHGEHQEQGPPLPSPSDIAHGKGHVLTADKTWQNREDDRRQNKQDGNAENDSNERAKGRSLADDQKAEKDRGKGRER